MERKRMQTVCNKGFDESLRTASGAHLSMQKCLLKFRPLGAESLESWWLPLGLSRSVSFSPALGEATAFGDCYRMRSWLPKGDPGFWIQSAVCQAQVSSPTRKWCLINSSSSAADMQVSRQPVSVERIAYSEFTECSCLSSTCHRIHLHVLAFGVKLPYYW